jgi:hypothetical protein
MSVQREFYYEKSLSRWAAPTRSRAIISCWIFNYQRPVDVWGQRRLRYLREHRPILYTNLKTTGQLRSHLADVEEQANALFLWLVKDYAASEGVTEQLKVEDPME